MCNDNMNLRFWLFTSYNSCESDMTLKNAIILADRTNKSRIVNQMTVLISIILAIQLFYWYYFFGTLSHTTEPDISNQTKKSISLIVCTKDEIANLRKNLPYFTTQSHENHEIIIADDFSTDGTSDFVKKIDNEKTSIRLYEVNQNKDGKKQALSEAMSVSLHNLILLTDADCRPVSNRWITSMVNSMNNHHIKIVLGYSPQRTTGSFLTKWAHFETWLTGIQYLSYAERGHPYMGVGRNLLYDKTLLEADTISKYQDYSSGDDDLTIMQIATADNTAINLDPDSFMLTEAPTTLKSYLRQKRRHYSTGGLYKLKHKLLLGTYSLSQILFYALLVLMLYKGAFLLAGGFYLLRLLMITLPLQKLRKLLKAEFSFVDFILLDFLQVPYYIFFSLAVLFPQKNAW